jgi:hypothetical protein
MLSLRLTIRSLHREKEREEEKEGDVQNEKEPSEGSNEYAYPPQSVGISSTSEESFLEKHHHASRAD